MEKAIIELYGVIEATGENSALSFKKRLKDAVKNKAKEIELHIHCPGGSVFEGYAIYNAIKASAIPIDAYIDGISASMATVIMLATRKVYMAENAFIMIHAPFVASAGGNAKELRKNAEMLEKIEKLQIEVYKAKTGKSEEYVKKWLVGDNWFNAEEAHEEKLIDEITGKSDINTIDEDTEITSLSAKSLLQKFEAKRTPPKDDLQKFKTQIFDILQFNGETTTGEALKKIKDLQQGKELDAALSKGYVPEREKNMLSKMYLYDNEGFKERLDELKSDNDEQINEIIGEGKKSMKIDYLNEKLFREVGERIGAKFLRKLVEVCYKRTTITEWIRSYNSDAEQKKDLQWYRRNAPEELKSNPNLYKRLLHEENEKKLNNTF